MGRRRSKRLRQGGFTLMELLLAITIFLIVTPAVVNFFFKVTQGFSADEARSLLKKNQQDTLAGFYQTITSSKRILEGNTGVSMLSYLDMTGCPATLTGSQFPDIMPLGSLDLTSASYAATSVGNCLMLIASDGKILCKGVTNGASLPVTVQLDSYRFYFYYLTAQNGKNLRGTGANVVTPLMVEWRSVPLVDNSEISAFFGDSTLTKNLIAKLRVPDPLPWPTPAATPVSMAVDTSAAAVTQMFYLMSATTLTLVPTTTLTASTFGIGTSASKAFQVTHMTSGLMGKTFRYGVLPNDNSPSFVPGKARVPLYAPAASAAPFPSGFEVVVAGPAVGRQVLIRSAVVAQGYFPGLIIDDKTQVLNCKDIW